MGMFERPGFGSVSFRDSIQTASLFSYDNLSDGINDTNTLRKETTENDGALKLVRFITFYLKFTILGQRKFHCGLLNNALVSIYFVFNYMKWFFCKSFQKKMVISLSYYFQARRLSIASYLNVTIFFFAIEY
jgi:hypothetical protein